MKLRTGDEIVGCDIVPRDYDADLLVVTSDGFGKRTKLSEFRSQNRGGIGLIATKFKSAASRLVALTIVKESDDIMMVTASGVVTRLNAGSISRQGRPATGVRAQNLTDNDTVCSVNKIVNPDSDDTIIRDKAAAEAAERARIKAEQEAERARIKAQEEAERARIKAEEQLRIAEEQMRKAQEMSEENSHQNPPVSEKV